MDFRAIFIKDEFEVFGDKSFLLVPSHTYDKLVLAKNKLSTGTGTVGVRQINRLISESGNRPSVFSSTPNYLKDEVSEDELVRWLLMYQQVTGTTDKAKLKTKNKYSASKGWLYTLNPIFFKGKNLFETLMLNLSLLNYDLSYTTQKPTWEYESSEDYIKSRLDGSIPNNISEVYTLASRMLHIEWNHGKPIIFSTSLPKVDPTNAFIEPMTTWKYRKKDTFTPAIRVKSAAPQRLWENFGTLVESSEDEKHHRPGIISWINALRENGCLSSLPLHVSTIEMISDGNGASQMPSMEVSDEMFINSSVLLDNNPKLQERWTTRIEEMLTLTHQISKDLWVFAKRVSDYQGGDISTQISSQFYDKLNNPFNEWLSSLRADDDADKRVNEWKEVLNTIALDISKQLFNSSSPSAIAGKDDNNIFTSYNSFRHNIRLHLNQSKSK